MTPHLGISEKDRAEVIALLQPLLADEYLLYTKTRNAHWNVTGPHFHALHKFFEDQYEALAETVDEIAERIRQLGGYAPGTLAEMLELTRLGENPGKSFSGDEYQGQLLHDHEAVIQQLRKDVEAAAGYKDAGTSDFLTGLMESHEKQAWMLRAALS